MKLKKEIRIRMAELILEFLEEMELFPSDRLPDKQKLAEMLKKDSTANENASESKISYSWELLGDSDNGGAVFAFCDDSKPAEALLDEVVQNSNVISAMTRVYDADKRKPLYIVAFTENIQKQLQLKAAFRRKTGEWRKKPAKNRPIKTVKLCTFHLTTATAYKEPFSVRIASRIRALHQDCTYCEQTQNSETPDTPKQVFIASDVYVANLYDLVGIYDKIGEPLFDRNVRYHIEDTFEVESEIKKMLRTNPAAFFQFNNGVSMQIAKAQNIDKRREGSIQILYPEKNAISVINGAQTLSAAADFFYQESDPRVREEAKEKAQILLRVIYPQKGQEHSYDDPVFEQISVALNRQKPIKFIDIQYVCTEVMQINRLQEDHQSDPWHFRLIKRGEKQTGEARYQLSDFGRLVRAYYYEEPGPARSEAAKTILQHDENNKKSVYAPFIQDKSDEILFLQWYKPLNFANAIGKKFDEAENRHYNEPKQEDNHTNIVLANGRYYFIAYVINKLNPIPPAKDGARDYSQFPYDYREAEHITMETIWEFAQLAGNALTAKAPTSNDFKKNVEYKALCQNHALDAWIERLKQDLSRTGANVIPKDHHSVSAEACPK